jgi:hypothetical protein
MATPTMIQSAPGRNPNCAASGCGASRIEREDLGRDDLAVEAIGDGVRAQRRDEEPGGAHGFAAAQREPGEGAGAE